MPSFPTIKVAVVDSGYTLGFDFKFCIPLDPLAASIGAYVHFSRSEISSPKIFKVPFKSHSSVNFRDTKSRISGGIFDIIIGVRSVP